MVDEKLCNCEQGYNCTICLSEIVSMIRKHNNHKLQTNLWHREEEPHINHETPGR